MTSSKVLRALTNVPEAKRYAVALSGGLDSALLLKTFRLANPSLPLIAIHVHHGLSPNADMWADHCRELCESLSIHCYIEQVDVTNSGQGIEAAARHARYAVFEKYLGPGDVLLQGHHQNDQAETVLLRALRGSSIKGLSGIPKERVLSCQALVYRPFLTLARKELEQEARDLELEWVEDESNTDDSFDRNFIRQRIIPVLEERWPNAVRSLANVAGNAFEVQGFIEEWCTRQFNKGLLRTSHDGMSIVDIVSLQQYSKTDQERLVRTWIDSFSYPQPSVQIFERIFSELIPAKADANPILQWREYEIRRYDGAIFCLEKESRLTSGVDSRVEFKHLGEIYTVSFFRQKLACSYTIFDDESDMTEGLCLLVPQGGFQLELKVRSGGESIKIREGSGRRSLKSLFQEAKVPTWQRDDFPLIYVDGVLAAVGTSWHDTDFEPKKGQPFLHIVLT